MTAKTIDAFDFCQHLAKRLSLRVIPAESGPYLSRYTLRGYADGSQDYLHFFHRSDEGVDLHNHPWSGESLILAGGYNEERLDSDGQVRRRVFQPGMTSALLPTTFHRVDLIDPRGCWTLFRAGVRVDTWGFMDRATRVVTPWREALGKRGLLP